VRAGQRSGNVRGVAPRKKTSGGLDQFNIRMPPDLVDALDEEVRLEQREHPGRMITRSDLIREACYRLLEERRAGRVGLKRSS
jgi:Arc/MetJ-type ribon-helix-helix transcriptional regulator